jgi:hypothetical protein
VDWGNADVGNEEVARLAEGLLKIAEEFGDVVGGQENWLLIYKTACRPRYDMLHMDLQSNPVRCYRNFTTLISEGEHILVSEADDTEDGGGEPSPREQLTAARERQDTVDDRLLSSHRSPDKRRVDGQAGE